MCSMWLCVLKKPYAELLYSNNLNLQLTDNQPLAQIPNS